jgi:hypothetical protein
MAFATFGVDEGRVVQQKFFDQGSVAYLHSLVNGRQTLPPKVSHILGHDKNDQAKKEQPQNPNSQLLDYHYPQISSVRNVTYKFEFFLGRCQPNLKIAQEKCCASLFLLF